MVAPPRGWRTLSASCLLDRRQIQELLLAGSLPELLRCQGIHEQLRAAAITEMRGRFESPAHVTKAVRKPGVLLAHVRDGRMAKAIGLTAAQIDGLHAIHRSLTNACAGVTHYRR